MKIYRHAVLPIALRVALFFPGISVNAIAASPCGSSNTTSISGDETEPYNLSSGENLLVNKGASIDAPRGQPTTSDPYGLKYSAVNVGENNNIAPKTLVDCIENNGVLQGTNGVIVTYSGSVGTLLNHGTISGVMGAIWASGHINTLDNYGSIKLIDASNSYNSIQIQLASNADKSDQSGSIDTIINREKGYYFETSGTYHRHTRLYRDNLRFVLFTGILLHAQDT
ncbi:hypothetical protein [Photorhabdus sp. RW14-46]|uniref:hypothetical protein n=1 Tax=Photorhabdus sp. RW14-46 TaxID=2100168 RepID=UPI0013F3DB7D|nr:hypothetical protein [Photorhabdus sp. RW14-46]